MNNKFKVTFVTKASEAVGLGHFNRSKILAEEMIKLGHQVNFYVYGKIFKYGPVKKTWIRFIKKNFNFDHANLCIVDIYNYDKNYYNYLKKKFSEIIIFNDNKKKLPDNISGVINPNIYAKNYRPKKLKNFIGKKYILLRDEFNSKISANKKNYIFICLGGSDPTNQMPRFVRALLNATSEKICAVVGPKFDNSKFSNLFKNEKRIKVIINPKKISRLMLSAKWAFSSSGSILYELKKLKISTLCISLAQNQILLAKYFKKKGLIKYLGEHNKISNNFIEYNIKKFSKNYSHIKNYNIIPGSGSKALAKDLTKWMIVKNKDINLVFSSKLISNEYNLSSSKKFDYQKVHWGSKKSMQNRYKFISKILPFNSNSNWLDIGSGLGGLQNYILRKYPQIKGVGLEISSKLHFALNKKKYQNYAFKNIDFLKYNIKKNMIFLHVMV